MNSSRKLTIEELANSKKQNKISSTQSLKPSLNWDDYNQRLKNGESMTEILRLTTPEEELVISRNLDLYKHAQDELSKSKLENVLYLLRNNFTLQDIVSKLDPSELFFIAKNLDIIQQEEWKNRDLQRIAPSQRITYQHQQSSQKEEEKISYNSSRIESQQQNALGEEESKNEEDDDDDDEYFITFGTKVYGMTFKQVLVNYKQYESWLRWLKFDWNKATSDLECAERAYNYFSKRAPNWNQLKAFARN